MNKVDEKILEYLARATEVDDKLFPDYNYTRVVEIAKMIQLETFNKLKKEL